MSNGDRLERKSMLSAPDKKSLIAPSEELLVRAFTGEYRDDFYNEEDSSDESKLSSKVSMPHTLAKRSVNFKKDDISVRPSEMERIDTKAGNVIKIAIQKGKKAVERQHEIAKNIVMQGQSLYEFPDRETLERHNETSA